MYWGLAFAGLSLLAAAVLVICLPGKQYER
jgi:hypothetical protein